MAEMAELDENFVRANLSEIEFGDLLMRRKEIYETLHPETKSTKDGGPFRGNQHQEASDKMTLTTKSFVQDTAEKLGVGKRTVEREIQTAKNLTPEAKKIVRNADSKITKKDALALSRLEPDQQKEAASRLAAGEICSMDEYQSPETEQRSPQAAADVKTVPEFAESPASSRKLESKPQNSLGKIIADLKNHDKDGGYTPDTLLADIDGLVSRFHRDFAWYSEPQCTVVFPQMSREQLDFVKQRFAGISAAMEDLLQKIERNVKYE